MKDVLQRESFAFSARVLGALFYFAPDSEQTAPLVQALIAGKWVQACAPVSGNAAARCRYLCHVFR